MEVVLWGVRGSLSCPTDVTQFYGTNTSCVEVRTQDDTLIIFDAGSGLRLLGETLPEKGECHLFISHAHTDHTQALGFFSPINNPDWTIHLYLPEWLSGLPESYFDGVTFPIPFVRLKSKIVRHTVSPRMPVMLETKSGQVKIESYLTNHVGGNLAYKVFADDVVFLYSGDHEITEDPDIQKMTREMLRDVNLAVVDAFFVREDYLPGWGHSSCEDWIELAAKEGVNTLLLSHHKPDRTDKEIDGFQRRFSHEYKYSMINACMAREGMRFNPPVQMTLAQKSSDWLQKFVQSVGKYKDESIILDRLLGKMREITYADAGTVYLVDGEELVFSYTHNDTLFPADHAYKYAYANIRMPFSEQSIVGYVAITKEAVNVSDVYKLSPDTPYKFNRSFDDETGYRTCSILTIPILSRGEELLGVLQLINSINPRTKQIQDFAEYMEKNVYALAREVSNILENNKLLRENIYRLMKVTAVHDPAETGPHAERVGAVSAEIYQRYAEKRGESPEKISYVKSQLRMAAMLHDVGKVGISDLILKKNGKLTDEEFNIIRSHPLMGSLLLQGDSQFLTEMAHDIALHHHQKWNGKGYIGPDANGALEGENIPLMARITALADVFDALVSKRCYKKAWSYDEAISILKEESGQHFDPEVVECFLDISDIVDQIYKRYPDTGEAVT